MENKERENKEKRLRVEGMIVLEKQLPFCTIHTNNGLSQVSLINGNIIRWKFDEKWDYHIVLKHLLMNYLLITKEKVIT